jgi:hypothetical protein
MKKLLTLDEVSTRTSLSVPSLRMRIFRRAFPCSRIGGRIFIEEAELEKFLTLSQQVTADEAAGREEWK